MRSALSVLAILWPTLVLAQGVAPDAPVVRAGVQVRMLMGLAIADIEENGHTRTQQRSQDGLVVQVFHGKNLDHALGTRGVRTAVRVCGRPAIRLHERVPASAARPSYVRDGHVVHGLPVTMPARETIQLRFEHRGESFALVWSGPPHVLARHRAHSRAFFRNVRCT